MRSIVYVSEAASEFDTQDLEHLSQHAIKRNGRLGLTGYLYFDNKRFIQYLEGPELSIDQVMLSIKSDKRHRIQRTIELGELDQRRFNNWDLLNLANTNQHNASTRSMIDDVINLLVDPDCTAAVSIQFVSDLLDRMAQLGTDGYRSDVLFKHPVVCKANAQSYVVAIGVSAGGLEPLRAIVSRLVTTKATFFVIPHFSPDATTAMDVILGQASHLKVSKASQGLVIKKGHVYLIPPGATLKAADGQFVLGSHKREDLPQYPIDIAYESISKNFGDRAIAVILSGAGTDGAKGAARIHQAGGTVLVQDPATAEFDGMPNSVINTDSVHEVLAPEKISEYLNSLATDPDDGTSLLIHEKRFEYLDRVIRLLRGEGFDFRRYKPDILIRRIERRKELLLCKSDRDYIQLLERSSDELASLCQDFLIAVTSFFRDEPAWEALKIILLPIVTKARLNGDKFRAWVAACSTGEEAYTLAIVLTEIFDTLNQKPDFRIYATDIQKSPLKQASDGCYTEVQISHMSKQRVERFYNKTDSGYTIKYDLRQKVIFAEHNFLSDAPFTGMHFVSCRNALIYMQPELQQTAIKMLHYSLRIDGVIFLGPTETLGILENEFRPVLREWNVYKKLRNLRLPFHLDQHRSDSQNPKHETSPDYSKSSQLDNAVISASISLSTLTEYSGATHVMVDKNRDVRDVVANPDGLLQLQVGQPSADLATMLPEGLRASLIIAVSQAFSEKSKIRQRALTCKTKNQEEATVDIVVVPHISAGDHGPTLAMVTIVPSEVLSASNDPFSASIAAKEIKALRNELELTKQSLKNALDEIQTSNDEQKTINEHLSATNVELQANNEEFLALNQKLYTKNLEHTNKISELSDLNHDIDEMMNKTSLGVVFLDNELRISRFTDRATNTVHLRSTDMQRPLLHLSHDLQYENFSEDLNKVLSTGESIDRVVLRNSTVPVHIGIHPYYNERKIPHGIFLTFREISKTELLLRQNIELDTA